MNKRFVLFLVVALALTMVIVPASISAQGDCVITFLTVWSGEDELPNWENMVAPFTEATGCTIEAESTRDLNAVLTTRVEAGNPPDITAAPSSSTMRTFIADGDVVPLDFLDMDRMQ